MSPAIMQMIKKRGRLKLKYIKTGFFRAKEAYNKVINLLKELIKLNKLWELKL
jgi:hypothetical protein